LWGRAIRGWAGLEKVVVTVGDLGSGSDGGCRVPAADPGGFIRTEEDVCGQSWFWLDVFQIGWIFRGSCWDGRLLLLAGLVEIAFGTCDGQLWGLVYAGDRESWEDMDLSASVGLCPIVGWTEWVHLGAYRCCGIMIWVVHVLCKEWCLWRVCGGDMLLWLVWMVGSFLEDASRLGCCSSCCCWLEVKLECHVYWCSCGWR
jgi:hypothetical protein